MRNSSRVIGYSEVILGRHLLAGEVEFSWEIPASRVKHRIAVQPSPVKAFWRNVALRDH
jgi:hypothetical protein